ncbi:MAG: DUF483 domain-containing protein, partial [Candidatus Roizmanbacteria bacterium]|nr:DUF483 domain-containing protein [Candidatus Roizmanbacteria bacterium]
EIVALYYDIKPLFRVGISSLNLKLFKNTLSELGFKFKIIESAKSKAPNRNNPTCLISKSEEMLNKYNIAEINRMNTNNSTTISLIGKYLGYPSCCIKEYTKNLFIGKNENLPFDILSNTKGRLDFRLNFLYNFESRNFNPQEYSRISESYRLSNMYLIPHKPCSLNCKESIKYAQKIIDILKRDFPEYYRELISFLKKPVLFYSDFVFFPLIGKMEGDILSYQGFLKIHDRLPIEIVKLLNKGNLIKRKNNNLQIYKDRRYIDKLSSSVKLFNFE